MRTGRALGRRPEADENAGGRESELTRDAIARAQSGDMGGVHFLYARYAEDVHRFVRSMIKDHHEAEDITQDVFIKLTRVIGKYEPREVPFAAWIMRVARNATLDHLRGQRTVPCEEIRLPDDDRARISRERSADLREALERLPLEQREVLVLRHIVGLSPPEIAGVLGKSESSIHGLHHRGRSSFRAALCDLDAMPVVAGPRPQD
jgi:RNA polymerase sigma-70 factor (ECF subfamily)